MSSYSTISIIGKKLVILILSSVPAIGIPLDQAYFQLAQSLQETNNAQEMIVYLEKTIAYNPEHAGALYQLGMHYYAHDILEKAYEYLERACKLDPHNINALMHAGTCAITLQQIDTGINYYQQAMALNPQSPKVHFLLGNAYIKKQNLPAAIKEFNATLELSPNSAQALMCLANALRDTHERDACLALYEKALALDPSNQKFMLEKAHALAMYGDSAHALALYQELYKKNGPSQVVMYNMAHVYKKMGLYEHAIELYQRVLLCAPDFHQAHLALAQTYLSHHNYYDGFQQLALSIKNHITEKPLLTKLSEAQDKTILITAAWCQEDMIQLARFIPMLKERGARILITADNQLAPLLKLCPYIDQVIGQDTTHLPYFDMHISLLALPALCITQDNKLPLFIPYITASAQLTDQWRAHMHTQTEHINVGIYWKSNEHADNKAEDKNLNFGGFKNLMRSANIHYFALQQPSPEELDQIDAHSMVTVLNKHVSPEKDIVSFCALLNALDVIITCDSLVAHLAGALGKPTILIVPEISQWRWVAHEHQSCFYPSVRIIRRAKDDYTHLMHRITEHPSLQIAFGNSLGTSD